MRDVRAVTVELLVRCETMLDGASFPDEPPSTGAEHLRWMCRTARENARSWPIDKTSRWLGFVQAVLAMRGIASVEDERAFSRPLFHEAYGRSIPTMQRTPVPSSNVAP